MDYELDITIQEDQLDIECLEQPRLMLKYTRHAAEMRRKADEAEEALDVVKAEVEKEIREDPEHFNIPKITEAAVKAAILLERRYKAANKTFINAKFEAKVADGAVKAFENRKDMLEALIKLHGQSYFAGPSVPHNITELRQKLQTKVDTGVASKIQRTK